MNFSLAAFREWYWAGGPGRRLLVALLISVIVVAVPFGKDADLRTRLLILFVGWDFGAWAMDKTYIARMARRSA